MATDTELEPHSAIPRAAPIVPGWPALAAVFVSALVLRLVHLAQIRSAPFFDLLLGDARSYHDWAVRIASGEWWGGEVFYQAPLYPYALSSFYSGLGESPLGARIAQAVIGSVACVVLAATGARLFDRRTGVVAGMLLAVYAPAIFLGALIEKSSLDLLFVALALWLLARLVDAPTAVGWTGLGLCLGALTLTRENALVLVGAIAVWMVWRHRPWPTLVRHAGACALGLALVLLPVAVRNAAVGGGFHLTTSQFGPNFYIGNNPQANGTYRPLRFGRGTAEYERTDAFELAEQATGRSLTPGEVSRHWTGRAVEFITSRPLAWLRLKWRTFLLATNAVESVDTEDQYTHAEWSTVLAWAGRLAHFGLLGPLAVLGMWITRRQSTRLAPVHLMLVAYLLGLICFYVFARYRLPLAPMLILFASAALTGAAAFLRSSPRREVVAAVAVTAVAALLCNWPLISRRVQQATTLTNVGGELTRRGEPERALPLLERAVELDPSHTAARFALGNALVSSGRAGESLPSYREALRLHPGHAPVLINLANVLRQQGEVGEALQLYGQALDQGAELPREDRALASNNLGNLLASTGRRSEAIERYRAALALDPDHVPALNNLGLVLAAGGDLGGAVESYRHALEIDPSYTRAHYNLGLALASGGRGREAAQSFRDAVALEPDYAPAWRALAWLLATARDAALRDPKVALEAARRAVDLTDNQDSDALEALAAAYASAGRFGDAARVQERAVAALAADDRRAPVARQRLRLYGRGGARD